MIAAVEEVEGKVSEGNKEMKKGWFSSGEEERKAPPGGSL